ncbi:SHOCT domain-containing protein [Paeniglutamicibacter gangotriensis]|nr:SHOCT domain-containing protein [Paeniglutamicibacter gangotriensis]
MDATDHKLVQLKQLGELRVAGVLTEEEFQGEKTKILAL